LETLLQGIGFFAGLDVCITVGAVSIHVAVTDTFSKAQALWPPEKWTLLSFSSQPLSPVFFIYACFPKTLVFSRKMLFV